MAPGKLSMDMHGEYKVPGGKLVVADLEVVDEHVRRAQISGDFFLEPDDALERINGALAGLPVATPASSGGCASTRRTR